MTRYLAIKYNNNVEDIVSTPLLDQMIESGSIQQFYRPSEQRWIIIGTDKVRGMGGNAKRMKEDGSTFSLLNRYEFK